jgi:hypothetical protein
MTGDPPVEWNVVVPVVVTDLPLRANPELA